VRCIECVTEPITPGHFCECCGRKLSKEERKGLDVPAAAVAPLLEPVMPAPVEVAPEPLAPELAATEVVAPETAAPAPAATASDAPVASGAPCESCGGPSEDGGLCGLCQNAFQALLDGALPKPTTPASDDMPAATAETAPAFEASRAAAPLQYGFLPQASQADLFSVPDQPAFDVPDLPAWTPPEQRYAEVLTNGTGQVKSTMPVNAETDPTASAELDAEAERIEAAHIEAAKLEAARLEVARREAAQREAARLEAAKLEAARLDAAREEALKEEAAKAQAAKNKVAPVAAQRSASKSSPAPGAKRLGAAGTRSIVGIAATVAVVASLGLGAGAAWYKMQGLPLPGQAQPAPAVPAETVTENVPKAPDPIAVAEAAIKASQAAAAAEERAAAAAAALPKAAVPPKVVKPAASNVAALRVPPKAVRPAAAPTTQVVSALAPAVVIEPVREAAAPPPPEPVVVVAPTPAATSAPLRPFFEPKDVNEQPAVASRVEPRLPDELRAGDVNEVLVVRLLVSQTGHPSSISLLRRSKAGQPLDDAVVAAVKQWTFSPAKKKGENVSCWLNIGVPVGRRN
jgi:TonB family protein